MTALLSGRHDRLHSQAVLRALLSPLALALLGLCLCAAPAQAQEASYVQHDYMKVPSDQAQAYLNLEQDVWKPIHRERAEDGTIEAWNLYEVVFPAGAERTHDFVTATFYDSWDRMEAPYEESHLTNAHPDMSAEQLSQRTVQARSLVRSEVVEVMATVTGEETESEGEHYVVVDYMKVPEGGGADYVEGEQELWRPIHQELIERTSQTAWHVVQLQFAGAEAPYQYMSIRPFEDWSYLNPSAEANSFQSAFPAAFKAAHPDRSPEEMIEDTNESRTIHRREVWRLVDSVEPPN